MKRIERLANRIVERVAGQEQDIQRVIDDLGSVLNTINYVRIGMIQCDFGMTDMIATKMRGLKESVSKTGDEMLERKVGDIMVEVSRLVKEMTTEEDAFDQIAAAHRGKCDSFNKRLDHFAGQLNQLKREIRK